MSSPAAPGALTLTPQRRHDSHPITGVAGPGAVGADDMAAQTRPVAALRPARRASPVRPPLSSIGHPTRSIGRREGVGPQDCRVAEPPMTTACTFQARPSWSAASRRSSRRALTLARPASSILQTSIPVTSNAAVGGGTPGGNPPRGCRSSATLGDPVVGGIDERSLRPHESHVGEPAQAIR